MANYLTISKDSLLFLWRLSSEDDRNETIQDWIVDVQTCSLSFLQRGTPHSIEVLNSDHLFSLFAIRVMDKEKF
jgi:hypothetical protein